MLNIKQSLKLTGTSIVNETVAEEYQATIDDDAPENMTITSWQRDKIAYKVNRTQCREDRIEFEEAAYKLQEKMIAEKATVSGQEITE